MNAEEFKKATKEIEDEKTRMTCFGCTFVIVAIVILALVITFIPV